ncbi:pyruvate, phosphate dikinase/phosphoenolpyruvate synthase regulator [Aquibacillus halophilus]|uniref:Putative pyruvate, phosphate dikinase regulatory protein n=1 Tax=Aquibacillus halophilus TaxID=930132 RepID=A0A6A8DKI6_9BACI|nr:pyruvate, water dikinase regulatory protein [Aquibacillus halophilus]MRH41762.1 pyruvate, phosphate dikinase/phosphoenolpyruvate synthase regulator [Aquibacillus halophilus]
MIQKQRFIYVCSDAVGETAEAVARATTRQFSGEHIHLIRYGHIQTDDEIREIMVEVVNTGGIVAYTLVQPELRETMKQEAIRLDIKAVDVMGPMMQAYIDTYNDSPRQEPGLRQELDAEYFQRIEAIEFAVKYDDGKDVRGLIAAQVVLIGVSRTSKTPLSIFLAHKGIKVANLPILPDTKPPIELFSAIKPLIIGLTMEPESLLKIRKARLKALGLPDEARYASIAQIREEIKIAKALMKELDCQVIDVSDKSIEETAGVIMSWMNDKNQG